MGSANLVDLFRKPDKEMSTSAFRRPSALLAWSEKQLLISPTFVMLLSRMYESEALGERIAFRLPIHTTKLDGEHEFTTWIKSFRWSLD